MHLVSPQNMDVVPMGLLYDLVNISIKIVLIYIFCRLGPNNEGCDDHEELNATISNSTVAMVDKTDFTSVGKSENVTETTEISAVSFETSTENATITIDDNNSTQFEIDNTTASDVELTTTNALENSTTTVQENSTATVVIDTTTDKVSESTTTEFFETTTEAETITTTTTTVKSKLCVDSEFECCPDGQTFAQVIEFSPMKNHVVV